jgi:hypothetical protein
MTKRKSPSAAPKKPADRAEDTPLEELAKETLAAIDALNLAPLVALEHAGLERAPAVFLLAYMRCRACVEDTPTALQVLAEVRSQPWVWSAMLATDSVRFVRACSMCNLPLVEIKAMQAAVTAIDAASPPSPPAPPARDEDAELASAEV